MLLSNSILQAHGLVNIPVVIAAIGGVIKLGVNYVLVGQESIGVVGAAIGTLLCFGMVALLDLVVIHRKLPQPPNYARIFVKPLIASAVMALAAWASHGLLARVFGTTGMGGAVATLGAIALAVVVYAALILLLKAISKDDLAMMPKGEKIAKVLRLD